jgi:hypothetical protein
MDDDFDPDGGYGDAGPDDSDRTIAPPVERRPNGVSQRPPGTVPPPSAAPPPNWTAAALQLPFGQPDALQLQRLSYGYSTLQQQVQSGDLSMEEAAPALRQIQERIMPLLQRKQQTELVAQQQANAKLMHAAAQEQAVVQMNAGHDAANFHARTATQMDPATGQTAHFFMKKPGEWEQVDFGNSPQANQQSIPASQVGGPNDPYRGAVASADPNAGVGSSESDKPPLADMDTAGESDRPIQDNAQQSAQVGADGQPLTDQPRLRTVYDENGVARQQRIPTLAERQAMDNAPTPQAQAAIASQIGHGTFQDARPGPGGSLLVQQGPFTEAYQNGQLVGTNRPQPQQAGQGGPFTPEELQHARNVADAVTAGMPAGLHRDVQHGNAMRQTLLATAHQKEQDRRTAALTQQQQTKATVAEKAKAAAALEQERKESRTTAYKSVDEEYKAAIAAKAKDANATIPPQYATPEARLAEAQRIHRESWAATHPDSQEAKDIAAGKATSAATAPSEMDRITALGTEAESFHDANAHWGSTALGMDNAATAKRISEILAGPFRENRAITPGERQQYDALRQTLTDPSLKARLDFDGPMATGAKGRAATVQRNDAGRPVARSEVKAPVVAKAVEQTKKLGLGVEDKKPQSRIPMPDPDPVTGFRTIHKFD